MWKGCSWDDNVIHKLEISLLGTLEITVSGKPIEVNSNYARALLCFLAIEIHHPHRREVLAEMLWPEKPTGAARNSLKQALSNLRMVLGDRENSVPFLLVSRDEIQFNQSSHYHIDAVAFTELMEICEAHDHDDVVKCKACEDRLLRAVEMYRGDFLADFYLPDNHEFNDWIMLKREVFQRGISEALSKLALIYEARHDYGSAGNYCRKLTDIEPWNEENHRNLMRLLALDRNRSAALRQYQICCESLQNELGVEPSNATVALYEEIKAWEPGAFPDDESPPLLVGKANSVVDPMINESKKPSPARKRSRRIILGLILAGLILGIGSIYWLSVPKLQSTALDPNDHNSSQIILPTATSTLHLTQTPTEAEETDTILVAVLSSTETRTPQPTMAPSKVESARSLSNVTVSENETAALAALFEGTDGTNWKKSEGWLSDRPPCEWYGITCRGGKIIALELEDNQLEGIIPKEIGQLVHLENLDLGNNRLRGEIPAEIGDLSSMRHLTLWGNRELSGPIPPELGNLTKLEDLALAHWESGGSLLSGEIPPELGNLKELRSLSISVSLLRGPLPVELCALTNLEDLYLDSNQLSGPIPPEIGNMLSVGALDLGGNDFEGSIPPEIGNLPMLSYLAVGGSLISGEIPAELGNLVRLRHLVLDNTGLSGPLPLSLMNLRLRQLTFFGTEVCEPADEAFQAWLAGINDLQSSQIICVPEEDYFSN
jgi:DNA-binding SARP family transcriptional activator/Leucine-rich repeat (LRR) protein